MTDRKKSQAAHAAFGDLSDIRRALLRFVRNKVGPIGQIDVLHWESSPRYQRHALGIDNPDVAQLRKRVDQCLELGVEEHFLGSQLFAADAVKHLVDVACAQFEGFENFQRVLVDSAEIAIEPILGIFKMLLIGKPPRYCEDRKRKDHGQRDQPSQ